MSGEPRAPIAVPPAEAARLLSMSLDHFNEHVRRDVRLIRTGRKVLVPVTELERWIERSAARTLPESYERA